LRDLQFGQSLDYPALFVDVDRERAGLAGVSASEVGQALSPATLSSRFTRRIFWRDPKGGLGFQVQVQVPATRMDSISAVASVPIKRTSEGQVLVRDVADLRDSTMPGEDDRYNGIPRLSLIANVYGEDLGRVANHIDQAIKKVNEGLWAPAQSPSGEEGWKNEITGDIVNQKGRPTERPRGVEPTIRGQIVPMRDMFQGLALGLGMAVVVIFLLLTAYFQSLRLAFIVISTAPAVIAGVALALIVTRTTLNIQSFMGSIMAVGVAVANAILLATFAERARTQGVNAFDAAVDGGRHRLRPILMTSCAMIAGMVPMALALGEGGEQTA